MLYHFRDNTTNVCVTMLFILGIIFYTTTKLIKMYSYRKIDFKLFIKNVTINEFFESRIFFWKTNVDNKNQCLLVCESAIRYFKLKQKLLLCIIKCVINLPKEHFFYWFNINKKKDISQIKLFFFSLLNDGTPQGEL